MSFPRYPKYKQSGVEWLGEVPEHWGLPKLKSVATFSGGGTPSRDNPAYWNGDIPWVSPKDMKSERIEGAEELITEEGLRSSASNLLPPGRVLIVVRSGILKHTIPIAITEIAVALNQDMKAFSFDRSKCVSRFFLRWVQGHNDQLLFAWAKQGATVESIEHSYLAQTVIPLPPLPEQTAIAEFLDRETGRIDELVAEQRRLMELLKEKRQAVISHAVTKGLNPHAPMKPSGIEWLGDVPVGWAVKRLKRISPFIAVGIVVNPSNCIAEEGLPFIYGGDIREGVIDSTNSRRISKESSLANAKTLLRAGDLLTVRVGAPGVTAVVPPECDGGNCASVMLVRKGPFNSEWLCYAMNTPVVRFQVDVVKYGAAQEQFNISHAVDFWVPCPPRSEQDEIVKFLTRETAKFDTLTAEAQRAIDLLQERRTALISAAVTGQIDVRKPPKN
jgi:type I restriction enzyme S subunit